jgi:hypothetical protein
VDISSAGSVGAAVEARALADRLVPRDDVAVVAIQFTGTARDATPTVKDSTQVIGGAPAG